MCYILCIGILYYSVLYCTVLYCTVLYCTCMYIWIYVCMHVCMYVCILYWLEVHQGIGSIRVGYFDKYIKNIFRVGYVCIYACMYICIHECMKYYTSIGNVEIELTFEVVCSWLQVILPPRQSVRPFGAGFGIYSAVLEGNIQEVVSWCGKGELCGENPEIRPADFIAVRLP